MELKRNRNNACLAKFSSSSEVETSLSQIGKLDQHILISCVSSCRESQFQAKSDPLPIPGQSSYSNRRRDLELDQIKQMYNYSTWKMYNRIFNSRKSQTVCYHKTTFKGDALKNLRNNEIGSTFLYPESSRIIPIHQMRPSTEEENEADGIFYLELE